MRKLIFILLCLPFIGFGQADLTGLIFQLIDSKDARALLEDKGWKTKSIDVGTDEFEVSYNEFEFSKGIRFSEEDHSTAYFTIREYNGHSNEVSLRLYDKKFFNHFQNVIVNSSYKQVSKDVERNVIKTTYRRSPLEAAFTESLNRHYIITLLNYRHKKKRGAQYFKTNAIVTSNKVNLRSGPSIDSKILGQVNQDDKVWVEQEKSIYTENQFIVDQSTKLYTTSREYPLNAGKMVTKINSSVFYNGEYRGTDSYWMTVSVTMDDKDVWGLIRKQHIKEAVAQKWFKIKTPKLNGWIYGKFIQMKD